MTMIVWGAGRITEVESRLQAEAIAREWAEEVEEQTITLSYEQEGRQVDEVLHDGVDHERELFFLEMNRLGR